MFFNFHRSLAQKINDVWLRYEYKHTTVALLILILFIVFLDSALVAGILLILHDLGYLGGFLAGMLTVSTFTVAPGLVALTSLANELNIFVLAFVTALGMTFGDWLLIKFLEEKTFQELKPLLKKTGLLALGRLLRSKRQFRWFTVLVGAILVATPAPDEVGLTLMGIGSVKKTYLYALLLLINTFGVLLFLLAIRAVA